MRLQSEPQSVSIVSSIPAQAMPPNQRGRHDEACKYGQCNCHAKRIFLMARIRTIKPEFFTSEDIVSLSPYARLLYIAIWCEADKEGRMNWKPATFKLRYMPGDSVDIHALCGELVDRGLVKLYGDGLAYIPQFSTHQHINPRESASQLPEPDASPRVATRQPRVSTGANQDVHPQVGKEGKGKEIHASPPDGVSPKIWQDFLKLRKAKKAPMTDTALEGIRHEAHKAGYTLEAALETCCKRGWQGFDAEWVSGKPPSPPTGGVMPGAI
jgi:hypothetical protein